MINDKKAKEQLIKAVESWCYFGIKDKRERRRLSIGRCKELQDKYGWNVLKKASQHNYCVNMEALKKFCVEFKQLKGIRPRSRV